MSSSEVSSASHMLTSQLRTRDERSDKIILTTPAKLWSQYQSEPVSTLQRQPFNGLGNHQENHRGPDSAPAPAQWTGPSAGLIPRYPSEVRRINSREDKIDRRCRCPSCWCWSHSQRRRRHGQVTQGSCQQQGGVPQVDIATNPNPILPRKISLAGHSSTHMSAKQPHQRTRVVVGA